MQGIAVIGACLMVDSRGRCRGATLIGKSTYPPRPGSPWSAKALVLCRQIAHHFEDDGLLYGSSGS
ncbi:hypothetical protein ACFOHY_21945 [Rhizobium rosettiformans]|uniref:hypothetical protein n=1 Tax=Rhizobium rosettiformans TaxID=1368430 RepID=UPI0036233806